MKCFDHPEADAVAVCLVCGRACCKACTADLGRIVCCRGRCEIEARRTTDLRDYAYSQPSLSESRMKWAAGVQLRGAVFVFLMGVIFSVLGALNPSYRFALWLGILFAAYGLYGVVRACVRTEPKQFRLCPHCGYNITGNTTGKCSECGKFC